MRNEKAEFQSYLLYSLKHKYSLEKYESISYPNNGLNSITCVWKNHCYSQNIFNVIFTYIKLLLTIQNMFQIKGWQTVKNESAKSNQSQAPWSFRVTLIFSLKTGLPIMRKAKLVHLHLSLFLWLIYLRYRKNGYFPIPPQKVPNSSCQALSLQGPHQTKNNIASSGLELLNPLFSAFRVQKH